MSGTTNAPLRDGSAEAKEQAKASAQESEAQPLGSPAFDVAGVSTFNALQMLTFGPASILQLQRSLGNRATQALISTAQARVSRRGQQGRIQRIFHYRGTQLKMSSATQEAIAKLTQGPWGNNFWKLGFVPEVFSFEDWFDENGKTLDPKIQQTILGHAQRDRAVQEQVHIPCTDGALPGMRVVATVHETVQSFLNQFQSFALDPGPAPQTYVIKGGPQWLVTAGGLSTNEIAASEIKGKTLVPCTLLIGPQQTRVFLEVHEKTVRMHFPESVVNLLSSDPSSEPSSKPKIDLSYRNIVRLLKTAFSGWGDKAIARMIYDRIRYGSGHASYGSESGVTPQQNEAIDSVIALLLGVEGTRNNTSYVTTIMVLAKIIEGQGTFDSMFLGAGGPKPGEPGAPLRHPLTGFGEGGGQFGRRSAMLKAAPQANPQALSDIMGAAVDSFVAREEMRLLIDWYRNAAGINFSQLTQAGALTAIATYTAKLLKETYFPT